ncbi:MAG: PfkB family carbohydrate kinase [Planctomycetota bacterium]|nr:PfkB family carbohydrate kinase [Planctomycetota bacterium]
MTVLGSVALDTIELPAGRKEVERLGGSGTFAALAASLFCRPVSLVGVVGFDFPEKYLRLLRKRGVLTRDVEQREDIKSFRWHGCYEQDLNRRKTVSVTPEILIGFSPVLSEEAANSEVFLLGNSAPQVQKVVLEQARRARLVLLDTMDIWIKNHLEELFSLFKKVDILLINDEEARLLHNEWNLVRVVEKVKEMAGVRALVVKRGSEGVLAFLDGEYFSLPAYPLCDICDPTGAGDTFVGALAGYLAGNQRLDGETFKKGLAYATVTASFCCESCGADRFASVSREDVEERFLKLQRVACF